MGVDAMMFVRNPVPLNDAGVRALAARMCAAFGTENFTVWPEKRYGVEPHHAISIVRDEQWIRAGDRAREPDEQQLRVHLARRYYGPGYERGDCLLIIGVAEWLECNLPGSVVFYGGDSQEYLEPFGTAERAELKAHFYGSGHEPYLNYFDHREPKAQTCDFCAGFKMNGHLFSGDITGYQCHGCGLMRLVRDGRPLIESREYGEGLLQLLHRYRQKSD